MSLTKLESIEIVYDDKEDGEIIDPSEWNNNFYLIETKTNSNVQKINNMFDLLESAADGNSGGDIVRITPIPGLAGTTTQGALESIKGLLDNTYTKISTDTLLNNKANNSTVNQLIKTISFNEKDGKFTITRQDGVVTVIDTLLERIVTNFEYDSNTQSFVLTTKDGLKQSISLSEFVTNNEFLDSEHIDFTVTNGKVTATIKAGAITDAMFSSSLLEAIIGHKNSAELSAISAHSSELNALNSERGAESNYLKALEIQLHPAIIGDNLNWFIWDSDKHMYADSGKPSRTESIGLTYRGQWSPSMSYTNLDLATYDGVVYHSMTNNINSMPYDGNTDWEIFMTDNGTIDCGIFTDIEQHNTQMFAHQNLNVDGEAIYSTSGDSTIETHNINEKAHQNIVIDGQGGVV